MNFTTHYPNLLTDFCGIQCRRSSRNDVERFDRENQLCGRHALLEGVKECLSVPSKSIIPFQWHSAQEIYTQCCSAFMSLVAIAAWRQHFRNWSNQNCICVSAFKPYGAFNAKHSLVQSVHFVTASAICCIARHLKLPHALHIPLTQIYY